jgi:hypothetical protein
MELKGIGKYTASAILAFAFKKPVPIVDTNVKRVLGRIFFGYKLLAEYITTDEPFWELKQKIVPKGSTSYDFNQGIMDFGATVCIAKKPKCDICPMRTICKSYPEILTADRNLLRVKPKRFEPLYFGQPRRIWRGRILQILKDNALIALSPSNIGQRLQVDWTIERLPWLQDVLLTMAKDQFITIDQSTVHWQVRLG